MEKKMSGDSGESDRMNRRLDEQQISADAEVERKRQSLVRTRMDIVKSVGSQQWLNPDAPTSNISQV
jgi:hypothetical protein